MKESSRWTLLHRGHKRGYLAATAVDFYAYVAFLIIIILFFVIFTLTDDEIEMKIVGKIENTNNDLILINMMRANVEVNGETMQYSDLIRLWNSDPSNKDLLTSKTEELLEKNEYKISTAEKGYRISFIGKKESFYVTSNYYCYRGKVSETKSDILLPEINPIKVSLTATYCQPRYRNARPVI